QPEMCPIANAIVKTVRPNASETPRRPILTWGNAAANTALPHPPRTNQNVPMNSAVHRFVSDMKLSFQSVKGCDEVVENGGYPSVNRRHLSAAQQPETICRLMARSLSQKHRAQNSTVRNSTRGGCRRLINPSPDHEPSRFQNGDRDSAPQKRQMPDTVHRGDVVSGRGEKMIPTAEDQASEHGYGQQQRGRTLPTRVQKRSSEDRANRDHHEHVNGLPR